MSGDHAAAGSLTLYSVTSSPPGGLFSNAGSSEHIHVQSVAYLQFQSPLYFIYYATVKIKNKHSIQCKTQYLEYLDSPFKCRVDRKLNSIYFTVRMMRRIFVTYRNVIKIGLHCSLRLYSTAYQTKVAVWCSGNTLVSINAVALH